MALAWWKKIEQSRPYWKIKLLVKRLQGRELWLRPELEIATTELGGWRFCAAALDSNSVVYSLGIGDDIRFDLDLLARHGCEVHAFDPTPATAQWLAAQSLPQRFHFHPWAITAADGTLTLYPRVRADGSLSDVMYTLVPESASSTHGIEVPAYTLGTARARLGHKEIALLKIDIEGAEYGVLDSLLVMEQKPAQLLVEFHHRFASIPLQHTRDAITKLHSAGYRIMALSETGREVSFMLA